LEVVQLGNLVERFKSFDALNEWDEVLSGGEK